MAIEIGRLTKCLKENLFHLYSLHKLSVDPLFHPFGPSQQFNDRGVKRGFGIDLRIGRSTFWQMIGRERLLLIVRGGWPVWNKAEVEQRKDQFEEGWESHASFN